MQHTTALQLSYANFITKPRYDVLIAKFGSLDVALPNINEPLLQSLGCRVDTCTQIMQRMATFNVTTYTNAMQQNAIELLTLEDVAYPELLRQLPDPPVFLYIQGNADLLCKPSIACVGTRNMSTYGRLAAKHFCEHFARANIVTVSGLALGIDAQVATVTIQAGGNTIAVLGSGLTNITPSRNTQLAKEIVGSNGLLVSEYPLGAIAEKHTFPARNRIIAGLCSTTLVLEAGTKSGAIITAKLALDYNRDVFAVPSQIFDDHYDGCHALISSGQAHLAASANFMLQTMGMHPIAAPTAFIPADANEAIVYNILSTRPQSITQLQQATALPIAQLNVLLTLLQLQAAVQQIGPGQWVRA